MTVRTRSTGTVDTDVLCYYHTPEKARLIQDAILPAARRARQRGVAVHLERHWLHGPHVRIRLSGPADVVAATAKAGAESLRGYLSRHPSTVDIDPAVLLQRSVLAGRAELVSGPYEPIHPDNTVRVVPADDAHLRELLGNQAAVARRAELLRAGLAPVSASIAQLLRGANTPEARVRLALTAMTVHAAAYPAGIAGGYQSFLSHLQDFLHLHDPQRHVLSRFEREWQRRARTVTDEVQRLATADRHDDPVPQAWAEWVRTAWEICRGADARGELPVVPGEQYAARARRIGDPATIRRWDRSIRTEYSDYHRKLLQTDFLRLPGVAGHFAPYRFMTNVLYLLLKLCDVTPLERYLAAHLLSQAVQRFTGVTWQEAMAGSVSHADGKGR
ncbi:MAG TPA: lantibiotic dehydratase C-terminal domain-containing protein [Micromonosporaceae bacterium]